MFGVWRYSVLATWKHVTTTITYHQIVAGKIYTEGIGLFHYYKGQILYLLADAVAATLFKTQSYVERIGSCRGINHFLGGR